VVVKRKKKIHIALLFGTRPEAIKLAPVIAELRKNPKQFQTTVVVTAQHREMLDQVLELMQIVPDLDLNLMQPKQTLAGLTAAALRGCEHVLAQCAPDLVMVQGDTATTLAGTMAAFYQKIPVGHVEAGLRTYDRANPFPEEVNRQMVSIMTDWHFAATQHASQNLLAEGIRRSKIFVTGNPVVDALDSVLQQKLLGAIPGLGLDPRKRRVVVVTAHRRENFGKPMIEICRALSTLAHRFPHVHFVFPVHRNPQVRKTVQTLLRSAPKNIHRIAPMSYQPFVQLLSHAELVLTDSGGIQEEAPALGVQALILRKVTERPEALAAGARLLPLAHDTIVHAVSQKILKGPKRLLRRSCPFGDGKAAERIVQALAWIYNQREKRPKPFRPRI
jgi:UDP-N-acetylglucosamine 2-epimerase (non-hydrolysing)